MKRVFLAAMATIIPCAAVAGDWTTLLGFTITSDYISDGVDLSDGPAFQPYLEVAHASGLYFGVWTSNVKLDDDTVEIDLYAGWRGDLGPFGVDLNLYRYIYNQSGYCCDEVNLELGHDFGDNFAIAVKGTADTDENRALTGGLEWTLPKGFWISGEYKYAWVPEDVDAQSWDLGVSKSLTDMVSLDLRYWDSDFGKPYYTVAISVETDLSQLLGR